MAFYVKSETEIIPVEKPPEGELPPLVIWGPGDPRPTLPIAGWNPGTGQWPDQPPPTPPLVIWGPGDPRPSLPIAEPPWGWGGTPPVPEVPAPPQWTLKYGWTETTGWFVFAVPSGPVPVPSKGKKR